MVKNYDNIWQKYLVDCALINDNTILFFGSSCVQSVCILEL